jgi:hypothetical protein
MHDVFQISEVDRREREKFELSVEVQGNLNCTVHFDVDYDQVLDAGDQSRPLMIEHQI